MNFFTTIGDGNGVFFVFNESQLDSTYYTSSVLSQMNTWVGESSNSIKSFANVNGVFENTPESKVDFFEKIKKFILPTETGYEFKARFFINTNLTEAQAATIILAGNINDLVADTNTTEINEANDSNGFLLKLIG